MYVMYICIYVWMYVYFIRVNIIIWFFSQNPSKFVPQFGGFCSWGVAAEFCPSYPWVSAYVLYVCMESIVQYLCMHNLLYACMAISLCMYVCMYVYLCLRLLSFLFVAKHYVRMFVCMFVWSMYVCLCMYVCMNVCM